jgi:hypothetical protein
MEGHYGLFTTVSISHTQEKLFCQTFFRNGFNSTTESTPPAQPQPESCQTQVWSYALSTNEFIASVTRVFGFL